MQIVLTPDRLAAVLCIDKDRSLEPVPQPFRLQPALMVVVPFSAYVEFMHDNIELGQYLFGMGGDITRSYYMNMARAVAKECYFSMQTGCAPTRIRHYFDGVSNMRCAVEARNFTERFGAYMDGMSFGVSAANPLVSGEWSYASVLCGCSQTMGVPQWNPVLEEGVD